jgi:putative aldouronate transport system permease protein
MADTTSSRAEAHLPIHRRKRRPRWAQLAIHLVLFTLSVLFLIPLVLIISGSLTSENSIATYGFSLIPRDFSLFAYQYILENPSQVLQAYGVTIVVTVVGSSLSLLVMALLAYPLSRRDFGFRKPLSFFVFFTLLFNGGLVPFYILVSQYLHLQDTIFALILPYLVVPWFVLLLRTFFAGLPHELIEASKIDGAGEWLIFFRIVTPLSTPALATIGLFSALQYWNDWWLGLLFINKPSLVPLQYLLYKLSTNIDFLASNPMTVGVAIPVQTTRMAMAVLAVAPVTVAFLFFQRYFIRGITLGGLKGD